MELAALVKKAKKGDGEAFVNAIKQYEKILYNIAKRFLNNEQDVADVMQETIMVAFEKIQSLQNEQYFRTWICKILINKCNEMLRKKSKVVYVEEVLPDKKAKDDTIHFELNDAINSLSKDYKEVVILYYIVGLNTREIGEFLGDPEGTIKSRLSRARALLKELYFNNEEVDAYEQSL
ncbi:RNA polymerase sigma factor [Desulfuribacillus alkaliarsenatis]|uniref:RNA polymerase subunit sigma n=1 Tax=Desulfuribacillus alkaliarsenatis TaxID=766136 RepID=A0A1E5G4Q2_9FIRM|nr:sigma-70 family RNA polymerase sigma factor [Desulfuribacillus alkaliarsenatis]OEF98158.1 RNA polymerase subunit sigma [Desulfuribacillus alkaliarsenatis]